MSRGSPTAFPSTAWSGTLVCGFYLCVHVSIVLVFIRVVPSQSSSTHLYFHFIKQGGALLLHAVYIYGIQCVYAFFFNTPKPTVLYIFTCPPLSFSLSSGIWTDSFDDNIRSSSSHNMCHNFSNYSDTDSLCDVRKSCTFRSLGPARFYFSQTPFCVFFLTVSYPRPTSPFVLNR